MCAYIHFVSLAAVVRVLWWRWQMTVIRFSRFESVRKVIRSLIFQTRLARSQTRLDRSNLNRSQIDLGSLWEGSQIRLNRSQFAFTHRYSKHILRVWIKYIVTLLFCIIQFITIYFFLLRLSNNFLYFFVHQINMYSYHLFIDHKTEQYFNMIKLNIATLHYPLRWLPRFTGD